MSRKINKSNFSRTIFLNIHGRKAISPIGTETYSEFIDLFAHLRNLRFKNICPISRTGFSPVRVSLLVQKVATVTLVSTQILLQTFVIFPRGEMNEDFLVGMPSKL